jgi:hypothetical protein
MEDFALRLYSQNERDNWRYRSFENLPVVRPCIVVIHFNHEQARQTKDRLIIALEKSLDEIGATRTADADGNWEDLQIGTANWLHVVVCDGVHIAKLDQKVMDSVNRTDTAWILPIMEKDLQRPVSDLLDELLRKKNVAFWREAVEEVAPVVIARVGVTCLDRRVFIGYRRPETSPLADQLFDALSNRNFRVFLDRVSIDPGVDFQTKLYEHLADKSMVVLLHSETFSDSEWTMAEVDFVRERRLSLLILRLPNVEDDIGGRANRPGEVLQLQESDIEFVDVDGSEERQARLVQNRLDPLVNQIILQHDKELVARIRDIRERIFEAASNARTARCTPSCSKSDASITLEVDSGQNGARRYIIFPSAYPPDIAELFDASMHPAMEGRKRVVVGHAANLLPLRIKHLDWVVKDRNVDYHDVGTMPLLVERIIKGEV